MSEAQLPSGRLPRHVRVRIEQRDTRLRRLGFESYGAYLASDCWEATKARYRASSLPQSCGLCDAPRVHLHHTTYERVGEEELTDLCPLCPSCHQLIHALERRKDLGLDFAGLVDAQRASRYAKEGQGVIKGRESADLLRNRRRDEQRKLRLESRLAETRKRGMTRAAAKIEDRLKAAA